MKIWIIVSLLFVSNLNQVHSQIKVAAPPAPDSALLPLIDQLIDVARYDLIFDKIKDRVVRQYQASKNWSNSQLVCADLQSVITPYFKSAYSEYNETGGTENKRIPKGFGVSGFIKAGANMTAQFIGSAAFNFYPVGDYLVVMVTDSKSISSDSFTQGDGDEVNVSRTKPYLDKENPEPKPTTYQTYLMILNNPNK